jgi:hypothetical protein
MLVRFGEKVGERVAHVLRVTHACKGAQADSVPEPAAARLHTRDAEDICQLGGCTEGHAAAVGPRVVALPLLAQAQRQRLVLNLFASACVQLAISERERRHGRDEFVAGDGLIMEVAVLGDDVRDVHLEAAAVGAHGARSRLHLPCAGGVVALEDNQALRWHAVAAGAASVDDRVQARVVLGARDEGHDVAVEVFERRLPTAHLAALRFRAVPRKHLRNVEGLRGADARDLASAREPAKAVGIGHLEARELVIDLVEPAFAWGTHRQWASVGVSGVQCSVHTGGSWFVSRGPFPWIQE